MRHLAGKDLGICASILMTTDWQTLTVHWPWMDSWRGWGSGEVWVSSSVQPCLGLSSPSALFGCLPLSAFHFEYHLSLNKQHQQVRDMGSGFAIMICTGLNHT